jgi:hypothetical protein
MGDRGNIVVLSDHIEEGKERQAVYLYTHWGGSEIQLYLKAALSRRKRWDDAPYLARIIFQQMIGNDDGETGFGIQTYLGDNEYSPLVVDTNAQKIWTADENNLMTPLHEWTFDEFIASDFSEGEDE